MGSVGRNFIGVCDAPSMFAPKELSLTGGTDAREIWLELESCLNYLHRQWTVEILSSLRKRSYRHGELLRQLEGVSQRILTRTLRNLESAGLVARRVTRSRSVAVEYS